jgi:sRNA-binding carbon storage regulator CsrA
MPKTRNGMLVLSRELDQEIVIVVPPSSVERVVKVKLIRSDYVRARLGTTADRDIQVHRREVYDKIKAEGPIRSILKKLEPA